jgi:hypothetical protein
VIEGDRQPSFGSMSKVWLHLAMESKRANFSRIAQWQSGPITRGGSGVRNPLRLLLQRQQSGFNVLLRPNDNGPVFGRARFFFSFYIVYEGHHDLE